MTVRSRFAPSPTGYLHIGGARTALYAWLYAKRAGGKFILRIEDTDRERSTQESVDVILQGMQWLGLDYDEGPFYQTQRFDRYGEVIQTLLNEGKAYRCYCTREELDTMRTEQMARKEKPRYDGRCRDLAPVDDDRVAVIRFRNPQEGEVVFDDLVRGVISVQNQELDDLIIARSDGTPTYNLTVVVDDLDMGMDVVIRGDDHINNTPRQINILRALGAEPPKYAHVPMILGEDGARLSKRHGAVSVLQYREEGYLPEALLNYLVRLGWSHGDQEIFSIPELIELFDLKDINRAASTFNTDKLIWLNHHYIMHSDPAIVAGHLQWHFEQRGLDIAAGPALVDLVKLQRERCKTLVEIVDASLFFYQAVDVYDEKAAKKHFKAKCLPVLQYIYEHLDRLEVWGAEEIHAVVNAAAEHLHRKMGDIAQPIRVAIVGKAVSPSIDVTLETLGREKTLQRIHAALQWVEAKVSGTAAG